MYLRKDNLEFETRPQLSVAELPTRVFDRYQQQRSNWYLPIRLKFTLAITAASTWMLISIVLAGPWAEALGAWVTMPVAWIIVAGIALIPGFMNAFLLISLALDRRPPHAPL